MARMSTLSLLLALAACGDKGAGTDDTGDVGGTDADGDGFEVGEDCDDADPTANPGATEVCDGVDNNCDGFIDEGLTNPFWGDSDGDGYGDEGDEIDACAAPEGYVGNADDCDDSQPASNPGAAEICDGFDNDCDELVDDLDDDLDLATAERWFYDLDGDGFGDKDNYIVACDPTADTVYDDDDCDDDDAAVNPDAVEVCNGIDDDCDMTADEADAADAATWYADADSDGFGDLSTTTIACDQPVGYTDDTTDCDDGDATQHPGADEVCNGEDDDCEGDIDEADAIDAATWYTDADGDGYGDASSSEVACDQPSGKVTDATDCDDGAAAVNPGATEYCDGVDNDCDAATSEDGMVTYVDSTGTYDVSGTFTGTPGNPQGVAVSDASTLTFCDGTYYAWFEVEADVTFQSLSGDPADVVLDAEADSSVFTVETDGVALVVDGLTLTDGSGDGGVGGYSNTGGAINCEVSSAGASVEITGSVLEANSGGLGGAVASEYCDVTVSDSTITANEADLGGGLVVLGADLALTDAEVSDHIADDVAGIFLYEGDLTLVDTVVRDNEAEDFGALYAYESAVTCTGTSSAASAGFLGNLDDSYGAIALDSGSTLSATLCDFGEDDTSDDNLDVDIRPGSLFEYRFGDDRTVTCDDETCGTSVTDTRGGTTTSYSGYGYLRGNVERVDGTPTIDSWGTYLSLNNPSGTTCTLYWALLTRTGTTGAWTVEFFDSETVTEGTGWFDSPDVGEALDDGQYVIFGTAWSSNCTATYYRASDSTFGFSSGHYGYASDSFVQADYTGATTSAPSVVTSISDIYHQRVSYTE